MTMTNQLRQALEGLNNGYNVGDPHPVLDQGNRLAAIARAASDAGMGTDQMRKAVRESMDARTHHDGTSRPFPEAKRDEVLLRIEAMMDFIAAQAKES